MSRSFIAILLGTLLGLLGTFALMLAIAGLLDAVFVGGPGPGAMVFYLSFVVSPVLGVVGGLVGARMAKRGAQPDENQNRDNATKLK